MEYENGHAERYPYALVVRSATDGSIVHREEVPEKSPPISTDWPMAFDPLGRCLVYPEQKRICAWPLESASTVRVFQYAQRATCRGVAFHPSGQWLAAAGDDGLVKFFDTASWKLARTFDWGIGQLRAVCFSADGTHSATIGTGRKRASSTRTRSKIVVWDVDL
jgi:WD40 repeat protein